MTDAQDSLILYHNPHCSKSRGCKDLLQNQGHTFQVVRYLETPPERRQLEALLTLLGMAPSELVRRGESLYRQLNLAQKSEEEILDAMLKNPILIERPIVVLGDRAVIARPPELVLQFLAATKTPKLT